ncbi:Cellular repressor of transcription [Handroanthus impetiginosus]|uniref:Cellular repressor of transcription n=1 Tax=Handroanthus impetiginosus TaxID=429701 RepID=A0A2G9HRQ2_9LAMI|nr:Cellular repressor of transcription [Handroanthus impetiginosus]
MMMKGVVAQHLPPSLPLRLRFLPRFNSSSSYSFGVKNGNNSSASLLSRSPTSPFKSTLSHTRTASLSPTNQNASTPADAKAELNVFQLIQAHQEKAARLPPIEEIRTLLHHSSRGVLSTFSEKYKGYPSGSMVDFACDAYGSPILAVSSLAVHTKDLLANPKCSLLVAKDPEDRTDLVIIVHGDAIPVSGADREAIRTAYLARHPDAFWVDFGDFQFLRIEPEVVRYVSGVATALLGSGEFSKDEFRTAKVDLIYQFSKPIVSHMNKDHAEDTKLIVQHSTSVPVDFAEMLDVDSLGFNVKAGCQGNTFKLRIPFQRRAADRKDVKTLIVEMLQAAKTQAT